MKRTTLLILLAFPLAVRPAYSAEGLGARAAQLAREADTVALGTCESAQTSWDEEHRFIVTTVQFRPSQTFKGAAAKTLTVKLLGGEVGNEGMNASHSATLAAGEETLLFLRRSQFGPYYVVWGGADGKLAVHADAASGTRLIGGTLPLDAFGQWLAGATGAQ